MVLEVTSTVIVHPPLGILAPLAYVTVEPPATAVFVPAQVPPIFGVLATTRLVGNVSTSALLRVAELPFPLPKKIVSVLVPFVAISAGENDLLTVGEALTRRLAVAEVGLFPRSVCNAPVAIVLV